MQGTSPDGGGARGGGGGDEEERACSLGEPRKSWLIQKGWSPLTSCQEEVQHFAYCGDEWRCPLEGSGLSTAVRHAGDGGGGRGGAGPQPGGAQKELADAEAAGDGGHQGGPG